MLSALFFVVFTMLLEPHNGHDVDKPIGLCTLQSNEAELPRASDLHVTLPSPCLFYCRLIHQMAGPCGQFYRPRPHRSKSSILVALLLLLSGVERNPGPGPHALNLGCININSVVQKGPLVIDLIDNYRLDAVAVCETKLVHDDPTAIKRDCVPDGYDVMHLPRPSASRRTRGGGLCFIYRCDSLSVKSHRLQPAVKYRSFECQLLVINAARDSSTTGYTLAIIYRPPSSSVAEFYDDLSDMLDKLGDVIDTDRFVACGDFNCSGDSSTSVSADLQTLFDAHGLRQFVTAPTRSTSDVSNLLDLVVGRVGSNCVTQVTVQPSHNASDHDIVTWTWTLSRSKPARQLIEYEFRSLKKINWASFQADVLHSELYTDAANTTDEFADQLDTVISKILDRHCPLQRRKRFASTRRDNRWLSPEAVDAKRQRRRLERRWRSTRTVADYVAYRKSCRAANKAIVESRGHFYNDRIQTAAADPRRRWTAIRNILHLTETRQIRSDDDCTKLCNGFAQFFVEKIRRIKDTIKARLGDTLDDPLQSDVRHPGRMFVDIQPPSDDEVYKLICSVPPKSSPMDQIPTSVIKTCAATFAPLIARLVTLSFNEGKFPDKYRKALVTPLLKKDGLDADVYGNYRPISNLHTISKIVERVFLTRLVSHVKQSPNYNPFQSAYRRGHSTETALLRMLNDVYCAADNGARTMLLQLDLSSAFDTIDMCTLLRRLRFTFGISGPALNWISSYLACRSQAVRVGHKQSSNISCEYGVPQGSVLGPLLFTLFMSPISNVISSFGVSQTQYADDTQLYIGLNDATSVSTLSDCFTAVQHWLDLNGLSMNPDKTEAIVIGTSARQRAEGSPGTLDLQCVCVKLATSVRSLGVRIDNTLSFNEHVDSVCKSSHFHLRALRHIRKHISADTAKTIACSMVDGRLDYCNSVLHGTSATNLNKLQRVQNSAARIVTGSRRSEHALPILAELHWLPIKHRIQYKIVIPVFKVLTTQQPSYLANIIRFRAPSRH